MGRRVNAISSNQTRLRRAPRREQYRTQSTAAEAADVRPPGHAPGLWTTERDHAIGELHREPEKQENHRGYLDDLPKQEYRHQHQHARPRVEDEVGPGNAGNRATGPDHRHGRIREHARLHERRDRTASHIEHEEAQMPESVLHVVAEDVEKEHVPEQVHEAAVEEHAGQYRDEARHRVSGAVKPYGDQAERVDEPIDRVAEPNLVPEHQYVQG